MFNHLYKQTVIHKVINGTDEYSNPIVESSSSISCSLNFQNVIVLNGNGQEVTAKAKLQTTTQVNINDLINHNGIDYKVIQVNPVVDFDGNIAFYEVIF